MKQKYSKIQLGSERSSQEYHNAYHQLRIVFEMAGGNEVQGEGIYLDIEDSQSLWVPAPVSELDVVWYDSGNDLVSVEDVATALELTVEDLMVVGFTNRDLAGIAHELNIDNHYWTEVEFHALRVLRGNNYKTVREGRAFKPIKAGSEFAGFTSEEVCNALRVPHTDEELLNLFQLRKFSYMSLYDARELLDKATEYVYAMIEAVLRRGREESPEVFVQDLSWWINLAKDFLIDYDNLRTWRAHPPKETIDIEEREGNLTFEDLYIRVRHVDQPASWEDADPYEISEYLPEGYSFDKEKSGLLHPLSDTFPFEGKASDRMPDGKLLNALMPYTIKMALLDVTREQFAQLSREIDVFASTGVEVGGIIVSGEVSNYVYARNPDELYAGERIVKFEDKRNLFSVMEPIIKKMAIRMQDAK